MIDRSVIDQPTSPWNYDVTGPQLGLLRARKTHKNPLAVSIINYKYIEYLSNIHRDTILVTPTISEIKIDIMGLEDLEKKVADHYNVLTPLIFSLQLLSIRLFAS